jgi:predicted nucleotide-binding protein
VSAKKEGQKASTMIMNQIADLYDIVEKAARSRNIEYSRDALRRWKSRTTNLLSAKVHIEEAKRLEGIGADYTSSHDPWRDLMNQGDAYRGFLMSLRDELRTHPKEVLSGKSSHRDAGTRMTSRRKRIKPLVFLIYGHDEINLLKLKELLRDRWNLGCVTLPTKPGRGRTLIEKFEQEAAKTSYAMALMTPDDLILDKSGRGRQARPNVILEIGWFCGRRGRGRLCILYRKGTRIPSDLDGISRIEFDRSPSEKIDEMENELRAARLIR